MLKSSPQYGSLLLWCVCLNFVKWGQENIGCLFPGFGWV